MYESSHNKQNHREKSALISLPSDMSTFSFVVNLFHLHKQLRGFRIDKLERRTVARGYSDTLRPAESISATVAKTVGILHVGQVQQLNGQNKTRRIKYHQQKY